MLVLARTIEDAGISTVLVTMMPYWAEAVGVPRTVGVEFPFGHPIGMPGDPAMQLRVLRHALDVLEEANRPGYVSHLGAEWSGEYDYWRKAWQPKEAAPIVNLVRDQIRAARQSEEREKPTEPEGS